MFLFLMTRLAKYLESQFEVQLEQKLPIYSSMKVM